MVRYNLKADESYVCQAIFRHRVQGSLPYRWESIMLVCGVFVSAITAVEIVFLSAPSWTTYAGFASGLVFLTQVALDKWLIARRLRKMPGYGRPVTIGLDWGAVEEHVGPQSREIAWETFTRALRMPDGFMLYIDRKKFLWMPDAALVEGTVDEANLLIKSHVHGYAG